MHAVYICYMVAGSVVSIYQYPYKLIYQSVSVVKYGRKYQNYTIY